MSEKLKDYTSSFHEDDLYIPTRSIWLSNDPKNGEVSSYSLERMVKNLHVLDNHGGEPITIFLSSPGGCVVNGFGIYDAIRSCRNYVRIVVYGEASSMGSIIFQAGDERVMAPNARVMIHDGTVGYDEAHFQTVENWQNHQKIIDERCYKIYLEKIREKIPDFNKNKLRNMMKFDTILTAEDAINLGLADRLVKFGQ